MSRFIVLMLFVACVAVIVTADGPKTEAEIADTEDVELKSEVGVEWSGPIMHRLCLPHVTRRRRFVCHPRPTHGHHGHHHHLAVEKSDNELVSSEEANSFLESKPVGSLHEECCHEGCFWEEILETC